MLKFPRRMRWYVGGDKSPPHAHTPTRELRHVACVAVRCGASGGRLSPRLRHVSKMK